MLLIPTLSIWCCYTSYKKKNRTKSTILKTQMMKKNLLLLSDCLKRSVKIQ